MLQTEFTFTLPNGYVDEAGTLHREGVMRLATALDEIEPLRDPRVRANETYLTVLVLSRVLIRLGTVSPVTPALVEQLFSSDFVFLQKLYTRINEVDADALVETACPQCGTRFMLDLTEESEHYEPV